MYTKRTNVTIDDIAKELGVSKTTVSRAISGKGRISQETARRVQECIEAHNYKPSAAAKGLAERKTYNLGLMLPRDFASLDLPFVRKSMSAICQEAAKYDYDVLVIQSSGGQEASLERILQNRKVDGVILPRTMEEDPAVQILQSWSMPFATMGSMPPEYAGLATVEADDDQVSACGELTGMLLAKGLGPLALLGKNLQYVVNRQRMDGFLQAHQRLGLEPDAQLVFTNAMTKEACAEALDRALERGAGCLLCMDDAICLQVMELLEQRGLEPGNQVRLASFYDAQALEKAAVPVTALSFDAEELGRAACRRLLQALRGEPVENTKLRSYHVWLRASTGGI